MSRVLLLASVVGLVLVAACSGEDKDGPPKATGSSAVPTANGGARTPSTSESTPVPGETPQPRELTGISTESRDVAITQRNLPALSRSVFAPWDGASVVLYDTQTGKETRFGRGSVARPAFGGNHFVYTSDGEAWLVDLTTLQRQSLGSGYVAYFLGDKNVVINPGDNNFVVVNLETGGRAPLREITDPLLKSMASNRWGGAFRARWVDGRYAIRLAQDPEIACNQAGMDRRLCEARAAEEWMVEDIATGQSLYTFRANKAEPAGPGEMVIATTPVCQDGGNMVECYEVLARLEKEGADTVLAGTTNIYLVNLETGEGSFVATATYNVSARYWPSNWPLVADASYVAWTPSYCALPPGNTRVLDRATNQIVEYDVSAWLTLRAGKLGFGEFGARSVLDPKTLQYVTVLPELSDVAWSEDWRFAAVGAAFGHGGLCP